MGNVQDGIAAKRTVDATRAANVAFDARAAGDERRIIGP